jgi:hypothetical protein
MPAPSSTGPRSGPQAAGDSGKAQPLSGSGAHARTLQGVEAIGAGRGHRWAPIVVAALLLGGIAAAGAGFLVTMRGGSDDAQGAEAPAGTAAAPAATADTARAAPVVTPATAVPPDPLPAPAPATAMATASVTATATATATASVTAAATAVRAPAPGARRVQPPPPGGTSSGKQPTKKPVPQDDVGF